MANSIAINLLQTLKDDGNLVNSAMLDIFLPKTIGAWVREALLISAAIVTTWIFVASSALGTKTPGAIGDATW